MFPFDSLIPRQSVKVPLEPASNGLATVGSPCRRFTYPRSMAILILGGRAIEGMMLVGQVIEEVRQKENSTSFIVLVNYPGRRPLHYLSGGNLIAPTGFRSGNLQKSACSGSNGDQNPSRHSKPAMILLGKVNP